MTKRRVVVTGMGVVSPYGVGAEKLWDGVVNGRSAVSKIENMGDMSKHSVLIAGEIKESVFNPTDYFEPKEARRLDKFLQYAISLVVFLLLYYLLSEIKLKMLYILFLLQ